MSEVNTKKLPFGAEVISQGTQRWDAMKDPASGIDGMPTNLGEAMLPHVFTFQGIASSQAKVYRASDESIKDSFDNARFMRNDITVMECVEMRQRAVALLDWGLEPEDDKNEEQKALCKELTKILKKIPRFMQYRENLLHATWFGKYGIDHTWRYRRVNRVMRIMPTEWLPIHGDKIVFRYDDGMNMHRADQIGIRIGAGYTTGPNISKNWFNSNINKVESTDHGLAYFMDTWERPLLALHKYRIEDGEYEEPTNAGRIHGVGIRSVMYWAWYQKQETLAFLMEYLERSATGIEIWYYPMGNAEAHTKMRTAAEERIGQGRNIVMVPRPQGEDAGLYDVQRIEPSMAGASELKSIITEYFGHSIKRYILGQTLTSEASSTGLGSSLADIHMDTFMQIIRYDANLLEETITSDLLDPIRRFNFPKYADVEIKFHIHTSEPDAEEMMEAFMKAYEMGLTLDAQQLRDLIGAPKPDDGSEILDRMAQAKQEQEAAQPPEGAMGPVPGQEIGMPGQPPEGPPGEEPLPTAPTDGVEPAEYTASSNPSENGDRHRLIATDDPREHYSRLRGGDDDPFGQCGPGERKDQYAAWDESGATLLKESDSGARYYGLQDGRNVRVADHPPNVSIKNWMEIHGILDVGIDDYSYLEKDQYRKRGFAKTQTSFDWDEEKHPRADDGKFTDGPGTSPKGDKDDSTSKSGKASDRGWLPFGSMGKDAGGPHEGALAGTDEGAGEGLPELPDGLGDSGGRTNDDLAGQGGDSDRGTVQSEGRDVSDGGRRHRRRTPDEPVDHAAGNWRYHDTEFVGGGVKTKFKANLAAVHVLRDMKTEGRTAATPEEQETLSKFTGWGQMPQVFAKYPVSGWKKESQQLKLAMSDEEFKGGKESSGATDSYNKKEIEAARRATLNSHFTSPQIVDAHWRMAQKLGFKGGRFLEPSVGSGYYIGMMPKELAARTSVSASELDPTTARVAQALYPSATIKAQGFQDLNAPDNFYDLVASNVPFGDYGVPDRRYNKHNARIHDYFFLKSVDACRPGGLVMHVTSTGTMDKTSPNIRKELAKNCDLISAIRMPGKTHREAAGTEVVTDLLILRKRQPGQEAAENAPTEAEPDKPGFTGVTTDSLGRVYHWVNGKRVPADHWLETAKVPDPDGGDDIEVNQYFKDRPEQILGRLDRTGSMYQSNSKNVSAPENFDELLEQAIDRLPEGILQEKITREQEKPDERREAPDGMKDGNFLVEDGRVWQRNGASVETVKFRESDIPKVSGMIGIRGTLNSLIQTDLANDDSDEGRKQLNEAYDSFVDEFGSIHKNARLLATDPDMPRLLSLEKWDSESKTATKADIFERNVSRLNVTVTHADNIGEAVGISLNETGLIDVDRLADLTDSHPDDIRDDLRKSGLAFDDPEKGWIPSDQYLSGNVRKKLDTARAAAENDPRYQANVKALEEHQPVDLDYSDITAKLGVPWVPADDMSKFGRHLMNSHYDDSVRMNYLSSLGKWVVSVKDDTSASESWTAGGKSFKQILDAAMNGKMIRVYHEKSGDEPAKLDIQSTEDVAGKINDIKEEFATWLWDDDERRNRLHRYYNDNFNNIRDIEYDGSHLKLPGLNTDWEMRDATKNFIWQVITRGKGICAHEVGYGKTGAMVASAMELRRLGLSQKPAMAVLKSTIGQITHRAQSLYPGAKILSMDGVKNAEDRTRVMSRIATGDYDLVIMTHEHIGMLQMDAKVQAQYIREEIGEIDAAIELAESSEGGKSKSVKELEKRRAKLDKSIQDVLDKPKDNALTFEQSGIDMLFVDESHKFKSLPIVTSKGQVSGIPTNRSDRATNMLMKTRWLQEQNGGRGVVFATGTPVANTIGELYNMQRYIQPEELKERGLEHFDSWANTFADTEKKLEVDLKAGYKEKTRLTQFTNVPELMSIARQDLDVRRVDNLLNPDGTQAIPRPDRRDHVVIAPNHDGIRNMMADINSRARAVAGQRARVGADNSLVITGDGRKGSVDLRLYNDSITEDHPDSKVNLAINKVLERYHDPKFKGSTQLVFSDIGVHAKTKGGFRLYGDIISKLVKGGVPREEIADFGELSDTERQKAGLAIKSGKMRIGIGGTERMGTGLNMQTHLSAIHHLDIPYVPASLEQRDGRGHRFGNANENVDIFRYVTEKSLDELSWGIVSNKANFIKQVITDPTSGQRTVTEEDTEALTPQQLMAAASGDTRVLARVNLHRDVKDLRSAQIRHTRDQDRLKKDIERITKERERLNKAADKRTADAQHLLKNPDYSFKIDGNSVGRKEATQSLKDVTSKADKIFSDSNLWDRKNIQPKHVATYRGFKIYRGNVLRDQYTYYGSNKNEFDGYHVEGPSGEMYAANDSLKSIEYVIKHIPDQAKDASEQAEQNKSDARQISKRIGKPFGKAEELAKATEALSRVEKDLKDSPGGLQYKAGQARDSDGKFASDGGMDLTGWDKETPHHTSLAGHKSMFGDVDVHRHDKTNEKQAKRRRFDPAQKSLFHRMTEVLKHRKHIR